MKSLNVIIPTLIIFLINSCTQGSTDFTSSETLSIQENKVALTESLTEEERNDILFMREEEKLARDVYLFSADKYSLPIFKNISKSEQQHMDLVLTLINTYKLNDPASAERGIFSNKDLQALYNDLIKLSDISLEGALKAGATIEDLDINDLDESLNRTDKADILNVFGKLKCGSGNHLRSYIAQLKFREFLYTPKYISQKEFDEIVNSEMEFCGAIQ